MLWSVTSDPGLDFNPDMRLRLHLRLRPRAQSSLTANWWVGHPTNQQFRKMANPISQMSNSCINFLFVQELLKHFSKLHIGPGNQKSPFKNCIPQIISRS